MTTPIKPPGGSSSNGANGASNDPAGGRVEGRSGELRSLVDQAEVDRAQVDRAQVDRADAGVHGPTASQAGELSLPAIERDVRAGTIDVDQAIDRLVSRALEHASALPAEQRAALEANLRSALAEDPTLLALRKDLERGSSS